MSEQDLFLKELDTDQETETSILTDPLNPPTEEVKVENPEDEQPSDDELQEIGGIRPKNRKERRRLERLVADRESSIFLAGKLEAREEAKKSLTEESDHLKGIERIYGVETPEAQLATDLLKKALVGIRDEAKNSAIAEFRAERQQEIEAERKAASELDNIIDDIEDTHGVTLNSVQEKGFIQVLQNMSPKDENGRVVKYADAHAVWDVYKERLQKQGTNNRAKDLSSRSMVQSGASKDSTLTDDSHARFLKENGII